MNRDRLVNEFMDMVRITSLSLKEDAFATVLCGKLEELGFEVTRDDAGLKSSGNTGNVIAKLKGNVAAPTVMFCAHMDTVVPGENIKPEIRDGVIYSDGTTILGADDKAGIAAILEAMRSLKESKAAHGDIEVVFTIAEEGGLLGSKYLDYSKIDSKLGFILDSGGDVGTVIVKGPSQMKIKANVKGIAAHAGVAPEKGVNAIQVAARAIDKMKLLRVDEETTANVGMIKGGTATNIVCDNVEVTFEARSLRMEKLDAQTNHMVDCIKEACSEYKVECEVETSLNYPSFIIEPSSNIAQITAKACKRIGLEADFKSTGGGSDTNIFNGQGIEAVTLAIGMNSVHTTSENISVESLEKTAALVLSIVSEIAGS